MLPTDEWNESHEGDDCFGDDGDFLVGIDDLAVVDEDEDLAVCEGVEGAFELLLLIDRGVLLRGGRRRVSGDAYALWCIFRGERTGSGWLLGSLACLEVPVFDFLVDAAWRISSRTVTRSVSSSTSYCPSGFPAAVSSRMVTVVGMVGSSWF